MAAGFIYYSPIALGTQWMKEMGLTHEKLKKAQKEMGKLYVVSFIVALITAYILSHVMSLSLIFYNYSPVMTGVTTGLSMWLGFIMPVQLTDQIFGDKNWKLFCINTGYQLISVILMGITIGWL